MADTRTYPAPVTSYIRPAAPEVRNAALRVALIDAGCAISHSATVADLATSEQDDDGDYICVLGNCVVAHDTSALDALAENLVDDNAERNDRTARGETGYPPLWPTPERAQRRRGAVLYARHPGRVGPRSKPGTSDGSRAFGCGGLVV